MENVIIKNKQVEVNSSVLVELIRRVEEIESLVETLEVSLDKDILKQIEQSKRDFAQGKYKMVQTKEELSSYLKTLG
ncbi:hypothetical protein HY988_04090 [Candidatus Micrarchaeota archaeon]|nr:hypothetical protein [Candidatus Micrarchaeota archaeon]